MIEAAAVVAENDSGDDQAVEPEKIESRNALRLQEMTRFSFYFSRYAGGGKKTIESQSSPALANASHR